MGNAASHPECTLCFHCLQYVQTKCNPAMACTRSTSPLPNILYRSNFFLIQSSVVVVVVVLLLLFL